MITNPNKPIPIFNGPGNDKNSSKVGALNSDIDSKIPGQPPAVNDLNVNLKKVGKIKAYPKRPANPIISNEIITKTAIFLEKPITAFPLSLHNVIYNMLDIIIM
ncbi:MAG: hypothetical protein Kow0021_11880 [Methanothermobacter thermautotrophicus]